MARSKGKLGAGIALIVIGALMLPIGTAGYFTVIANDQNCGVPNANGVTTVCGTGTPPGNWLLVGIAGAGILAGGIVLLVTSEKKAAIRA